MLFLLSQRLNVGFLTVISCLCFSPIVSATTNNSIILENQRAASPNWTLQNPALKHEIEAYGDLTSLNKGQSLNIYVNTDSEKYTWELFRMGWYGGGGARRITDAKQEVGFKQSACPLLDDKTGLIECDWQKSFSIHTADYPDLISGFYLVRLTEMKTKKDSYVLFVLREDQRHSDFVFVHSITTDVAYSSWGGRWLYFQGSKTSLNRPMLPPNFSPNVRAVGTGYFFAYYDYNLVRWMEREGYDLKYLSNLDVHEDYNRFANSHIFLSVGHDEYWSKEMKENLTQYRDKGKNIAFFSSNAIYWQIRFEPDSKGRPNRRITCHRKAHLDPELSPANKTTRFRDQNIDDHEDSLIGVLMDGDFPSTENDMTIRDASHWMFKGTGLEDGDKLKGMLGFEVDRMWWKHPRSTKRLAVSKYYGPRKGPSFSDMTLYKSQSGGLVFATGSMQWIWGLDDSNFFGLKRNLRNLAVEKISRNIFEEMLHPKNELAPYPSDPILLDLNFQDPSGSTHFKDASAYDRSVLCHPEFCPQIHPQQNTTQVLHFSNQKNYLDLGIESSLRGQAAFSIELKIRLEQDASGPMIILQQRDERGTSDFSGFEGSYQISLNHQSQVTFWTWSRNTGFAIKLISKQSINDGQWHYIQISRRKDGSAFIKIDDKIDVEQQTHKITELKPHTLFLGHDPMANHMQFRGDIARLRITEL